MKIVDAAGFKDAVANSSVPLVVDFFADWCGPCKMLAPVLESLSAEFDGKLEILKVDIDKNPDLAREYGVASIPTIVYMKSGSEVDRSVGFQSKDALAAKFNSFL